MYSLRGVDGGAEADMTVSGLQQRVLQLELSFFFGRQIQPELYPGDHSAEDERYIIRPIIVPSFNFARLNSISLFRLEFSQG